jgi:hypothetical protein
MDGLGRCQDAAPRVFHKGGGSMKAECGWREEGITTDSLRMAGSSSHMGHTTSGDTHASAVLPFPLRRVATTDGILSQLSGGVQ